MDKVQLGLGRGWLKLGRVSRKQSVPQAALFLSKEKEEELGRKSRNGERG